MKLHTLARARLHISFGALMTFPSMAVSAAAQGSEPLVIGETFQIESKVLAETRTYVVQTPDYYNKRTEAYPVLVLLDAENSFAYASAAVHLLSADERIPAMIVVGINNTNRFRDMTPSNPAGGTPTGEVGGADKFLSFIADELLPTVDRNYRTRPYRVLIGHSRAGLFAAYALLSRPEVFKGYLMSSPALGWDNEALIKAAQSFFAVHKDLRADLYMSMANEVDAMLGGAWKLSTVLKESNLPNLRWQFKRYPEEDHGTVPYISTYDGLQAIFAGFSIANPIALFEEGGFPAFQGHYVEVSKRLGYTVPVPARAYGDTLSELLNRGRFAEAEEVGQKMLELNPKNTWALFTLADVAAKQNDDAKAIRYLTQVLKLYPGSTEARAGLAKYQVDVDKIVPSLELTAKAVASYAGAYRFQNEITHVAYQNGKLMAYSSFGKCELRALTLFEFYCVDVEVELRFSQDNRGRVTGVTEEWDDHNEEFKKVK
jgi:predicted alpha/beta superfamily hydrolase